MLTRVLSFAAADIISKSSPDIQESSRKKLKKDDSAESKTTKDDEKKMVRFLFRRRLFNIKEL